MAIVVGLLVILFVAFVIGRLGAIAVPGPDPMPAWLSILIGGIGAFIGGGLGYGAGGQLGFVLGALVVSSLLVILYRRIVQRRGITGPEAWRFPTRGFGVKKVRARMGIDTSPSDPTERHLAQLEELRDAGLLTRDEFEAKKAMVLAGK